MSDDPWKRNAFGERIPSNGGKFTSTETQTVRQAVEDYCASKNLSIERLCSECDRKPEFRGAWVEIAKKLPHRPIASVYRHGIRQMHPFKRGPWSEEEAQTLVDLVARIGRKWSVIQGKLYRSAEACVDKYRELSSEYSKGTWDEGETEILTKMIRDHLGVGPDADIKELGKRVEQEGIILPWSAISKRVKKRSRLSCLKKWQNLSGVYVDEYRQKNGNGTRTRKRKRTKETSRNESDTDADDTCATSSDNTSTESQQATVRQRYDNETPVNTAASNETATRRRVNSRAAPVRKSRKSQRASRAVKDVVVAEVASSSNPRPETADAFIVDAVSVQSTKKTSLATRRTDSTADLGNDYDRCLLTAVMEMGASREADVNWSTIRHPQGDALARWNELLEEVEDDGIFDLPTSDMAKAMLEMQCRKS